MWDANGRELAARFAPAEDGVTLQVDAKDARYPLTIDPIAQQAYLKEPGGATPGALFGHAVAVSGSTAVVVAPNSKTPPSGVVGGVAHVYVRNGPVPPSRDDSFRGAVLQPNATAWTTLCDRESKTDFQPIEPREVLSKLAAVPVTSWQYKHDPSRRYIGPTSQDFMSAFHLGHDDKGINTLDADGVTFAAIKGLVEELKERDKEIAELKTKSAEVEHLKRKLEITEERLDSLPPAP